MRPVRIEMEGFSAFREPTVVDFTDVDLFAFVGPTGAGKSSVIDAMVFALYGSVPRYESENLVHPVITQGKVEARVRLDFTVGGVAHTAVRVVRRTKAGATTREARLERGDEVLAEDPRSLSTAVADLIGLDLEQFTKCVVLPQGAFARLLHDRTAKRQDLLVKLLDLGLYERVASAARGRVKDTTVRIEAVDGQVAALAHATHEAIGAALAHVEAVDAVIGALDDAEAELEALDQAARSAAARCAEQEGHLTVLDAVRVPDGLDVIADQVRQAEAAVTDAERTETVTAAAVDEAEEARAALGEPTALVGLRQAWTELEALQANVDKGETLTAERRAGLRPLEDEHARRTAARQEAEAALVAAQVDHAAAHVARHLRTGDDCPVCGHTVSRVRTHDDQALAAAEAAVATAVAEHAEAEAALAAHRQELATYEARLEERRRQRDEVRARLGDAPAAEVLDATIREIAAADRRVEQARNDDRRARAAAVAARRAVDEATRAAGEARSAYTAARDAVAALGPPAGTDDLAADWAALATWAGERRAQVERDAAAARAEAEAARRARVERGEALAALARDAGVRVDEVVRLRDACVTEASEARARHRRLVEEHETAEALRSRRDELDEDRQVHELLVSQLGAKGFEAWLLDEALDLLVEGASATLHQLSSGRYAMAVDDKKQFEVIDHANADDRRLAKTLSGGETFLASLALALALAERVSELSATGGASLEAIFLDEGFGTLDIETLDVVASAIEELGATGRMVGIVSHVRELAERVPVRFEVRKGPHTSSLVRVDQ